MSSILENCGGYSEKLEKISGKIFEKTKLNTIITNDTKDIIDLEVFQAYEQILEVYKNDQVSISKVLSDFEKMVETGNNDIKLILTTVIQNRDTDIDLRKNNSVLATENTVVLHAINKKEPVKLDTIFNEKLLKDMDISIEMAKNGNEKNIEEVELITKISNFIANHSELDEKSERGALAWMKRLSVSGSELAGEFLKEMSTKYGYDFYTEKGFDNEKFDQYFENKIGKVNRNILSKSESDWENLNRSDAQKAIDVGKYEKEDISSKSIIDNANLNAKINMFRRKVNDAIKSGNSELINDVANSDPEMCKIIIKEKINIYNFYSASNRKTDNILNDLHLLNSALPKDKELEVEIDPNVHKKEKDDFSL